MDCDEDCVRDIVREELEKFQASNPKQTKKGGGKKKSQWNLFLAECSKRQPKGLSMGEKSKACSVEYKEFKKNQSN